MIQYHLQTVSHSAYQFIFIYIYILNIVVYFSAGCDLVFFPAAYPVRIGSQAWELVHRARANDNQFFVAAISSARDDQADYVVYGHSMIIDPTGKILAQAGTSEEIVFHELGEIYNDCRVLSN